MTGRRLVTHEGRRQSRHWARTLRIECAKPTMRKFVLTVFTIARCSAVRNWEAGGAAWALIV